VHDSQYSSSLIRSDITWTFPNVPKIFCIWWPSSCASIW